MKVFMNVGGWKHGLFNEIPNNENLLNAVDKSLINQINKKTTIELFVQKQVNFFVLIKNPYMWIVSKSETEKKSIIPSFVIKEIDTWNKHYSDYKKYIMDEKAFLVKYESLLEDPVGMMDSIKEKFGFIKLFEEYKFEKNKLKACTDACIGSVYSHKCDTSRYTNLNVSKYLSNDIILLINEHIDKSLMEFYQYKIEEVST